MSSSSATPETVAAAAPGAPGELELLLEFLYTAPIGLVQASCDGTIEMISVSAEGPARKFTSSIVTPDSEATAVAVGTGVAVAGGLTRRTWELMPTTPSHRADSSAPTLLVRTDPSGDQASTGRSL